MSNCDIPDIVFIEACVGDGTQSLIPGDLAQITAQVRLDGVDTDPSDLSVTVTDPSGAATTYVYGVDAELTKDENEVGFYELTITVPSGAASVGTWSFVWNASGDFTGEAFGSFEVFAAKSTLTISVQDALAAAVTDARVDLHVGGFVTASASTGSTGSAVFPQMLDGTYLVRVHKVGWRFTDTTYVKSGAATVVVTGADLDINVSPTTELCRVYGHLVGATGQPLPAAKVFVEVIGQSVRALVASAPRGVASENVGVARGQYAIPVKSNGYWEAELVVGATVRLVIPELGYERTFRVPPDTTLNWADIRPAPGARLAGQPVGGSGGW